MSEPILPISHLSILTAELALSLMVDLFEDAGTLHRLGIVRALPQRFELWTNRFDFLLAILDLGISAVAHARQLRAFDKIEERASYTLKAPSVAPMVASHSSLLHPKPIFFSNATRTLTPLFVLFCIRHFCTQPLVSMHL